MSDRTRKASLKTDAAARQGRALLQIWLSPSFPVGAYAYSHGIEKAVELGWIKDRETLEAWLQDLSSHGSLRNDLILLLEAHRLAGRADRDGLRQLADLSSALQPSAERHLEATQQGQSFLLQISATWANASLQLATIFAETQPSVPVVLGVAADAHGIGPEDTALAYSIAFVSNVISAAVRLSVIGQTDGQRTIAALMPTLTEIAMAAAQCSVEHLGSATFRSDIASMQHETQYTRLFRS
jgi:urease accessory protein